MRDLTEEFGEEMQAFLETDEQRYRRLMYGVAFVAGYLTGLAVVYLIYLTELL